MKNSILVRRNTDIESGIINPCVINFDQAMIHSNGICPMADIDVFARTWGYRLEGLQYEYDRDDFVDPKDIYTCDELYAMANRCRWIPRKCPASK